jgi:hypothetical protein
MSDAPIAAVNDFIMGVSLLAASYPGFRAPANRKEKPRRRKPAGSCVSVPFGKP